MLTYAVIGAFGNIKMSAEGNDRAEFTRDPGIKKGNEEADAVG